jgi:hypothetical protein
MQKLLVCCLHPRVLLLPLLPARVSLMMALRTLVQAWRVLPPAVMAQVLLVLLLAWQVLCLPLHVSPLQLLILAPLLLLLLLGPLLLQLVLALLLRWQLAAGGQQLRALRAAAGCCQGLQVAWTQLLACKHNMSSKGP